MRWARRHLNPPASDKKAVWSHATVSILRIGPAYWVGKLAKKIAAARGGDAADDVRASRRSIVESAAYETYNRALHQLSWPIISALPYEEGKIDEKKACTVAYLSLCDKLTKTGRRTDPSLSNDFCS
jgi:hypothetical protein